MSGRKNSQKDGATQGSADVWHCASGMHRPGARPRRVGVHAHASFHVHACRQRLKASCKMHDEYESVMHLDAPAAAPRGAGKDNPHQPLVALYKNLACSPCICATTQIMLFR